MNREFKNMKFDGRDVTFLIDELGFKDINSMDLGIFNGLIKNIHDNCWNNSIQLIKNIKGKIYFHINQIGFVKIIYSGANDVSFVTCPVHIGSFHSIWFYKAISMVGVGDKKSFESLVNFINNIYEFEINEFLKLHPKSSVSDVSNGLNLDGFVVSQAMR